MARVRRQDFPNFNRGQRDAERFFKALPRLAGNTALNFFKDSWDREAFLDEGREKWTPRKTTSGTRRRLLVQTGRLRRSLRMQYTHSQVTISTDVPYAKIHNEGGTVQATVTVRAHTRKGNVSVRAHTRNVNYTMPKRQYMGASKTLDKRLELLVTKALQQIF